MRACASDSHLHVSAEIILHYMSNKRCSVIVETVSDVSECVQVIVARLGDLSIE